MTSMPKHKQTNTSKTPARKAGGSLRLRSIKYYLAQTFKSLWRNKFMSLTSIVTVAACMVMVVASFAVTSNVSLFLTHIESEVGITVHIDDDFTYTQRLFLLAQVEGVSNVSGARIVDPEEALRNLAIMLGDEYGILERGFEDEDNPLSYSIVAQLHSVRLQRETIEEFYTFQGVRLVDASAAAAEMLISANNFMAIFGLIVVSVLGILSVVIITNTIKLTVNNRRNEIVIMKYVGATDGFIRWPFIIEGVFIGIIGGLIPLIAAWLSYEALVDSMTTSGDGIIYMLVRGFPFRASSEIFPVLTPIIIVLGGAIGVLGSMTSMRKHLNV